MAVWPYVNHMTILAITILPDHMVYVWPYGVWLESLSTVLTTVSLPYLNAPEAFSTFISYYSDSSYNININLRS